MMYLSNADTVLSAMRRATHDLHRSLEEELSIAHPGATRDDYLTYLSAMWGWLAPIEKEIWREGWPETLQAQRRAVKCAWLEKDLVAAELDPVDIAALPLHPSLPVQMSFAERCGWAYVIEGSQLGGQVLKKRLAGTLQPRQARWLEGYREETTVYWKTFVAYLESVNDPQLIITATSAAVDAFITLAEWMKLQGACSEQHCVVV